MGSVSDLRDHPSEPDKPLSALSTGSRTWRLPAGIREHCLPEVDAGKRSRRAGEPLHVDGGRSPTNAQKRLSVDKKSRWELGSVGSATTRIPAKGCFRAGTARGEQFSGPWPRFVAISARGLGSSADVSFLHTGRGERHADACVQYGAPRRAHVSATGSDWWSEE
jgi:hypothetical protein